MDMGFEMRGWQPAPADQRAEARLVWHALRSRLAAAHQARRALGAVSKPAEPVTGGSFDRRSARAIAVYDQRLKAELGAINPSALGNGKLTYDKDAAVAGAYVAGD